MGPYNVFNSLQMHLVVAVTVGVTDKRFWTSSEPPPTLLDGFRRSKLGPIPGVSVNQVHAIGGVAKAVFPGAISTRSHLA